MPPSISDSQLDSLLDLAFDFLCDQRLEALVDPAKILPALDEALRPDRVLAREQTYLAPLRERLFARMEASALTLRAWLPEPVIEGIAERLGKPAPIPKKMIDELVASEKVRDAVRTMLQESLSSFVAKGMGTDQKEPPGGLRGALGFGARAAAAAGKGILGGFGEELQKRLQERVRDFVDSSVATLQKRIAEKLESEETAKALGARRRGAFLTLLETTEKRAAAKLRKARAPEMDLLAPAIIAHNLARPEVRVAIEQEVEQAVRELSKETLGAHLDAAGLREQTRAWAHAHLRPLCRAFVDGEGFARWHDVK